MGGGGEMYYCTVAAIEQYILLSLFVPLLALACLRKIKQQQSFVGCSQIPWKDKKDPREDQEGGQMKV